MGSNSEIEEILKTISLFDVDEDYDDREAREKLASLFNRIIMSDDPSVKEFFKRFINEIDTILYDMGISEEKPKEETEENPEEITPPEESEENTPEEAGGEGEEEKPAGNSGEIPDELLSAGYNVLVNMANEYIY